MPSAIVTAVDESRQTTLLIQLEDGSHRHFSWPRYTLVKVYEELAYQRRSRLHTVVRATVFIGADKPKEIA